MELRYEKIKKYIETKDRSNCTDIKNINMLKLCKEKTSVLLRDCKIIPQVLRVSKN